MKTTYLKVGGLFLTAGAALAMSGFTQEAIPPELPPIKALRAPEKATWGAAIEYLAKEERPPEIKKLNRVTTLLVHKEKNAYLELKLLKMVPNISWVLPAIQFVKAETRSDVIRVLAGDSGASDCTEIGLP